MIGRGIFGEVSVQVHKPSRGTMFYKELYNMLNIHISPNHTRGTDSVVAINDHWKIKREILSILSIEDYIARLAS